MYVATEKLRSTLLEFGEKKFKETVGRPKKSMSNADTNKEKHSTRNYIAKELLWGNGKVARADYIANNGTPETILNLQSGDITINEAYKYTQREQTNSKRNRSAELGEIIGLPPNIDLRYGDFKTVLADIPDDSLDLILTDPPYPKEFLPL